MNKVKPVVTDLEDLLEARILLELFAVKLAAQRRTIDDLAVLQNAQSDFARKVKNGHPAIEEDLQFHLKIMEASKNAVLKSLLLSLTTAIIQFSYHFEDCYQKRGLQIIEEHELILAHIADQNPVLAEQVMKRHFKEVIEVRKVEY